IAQGGMSILEYNARISKLGKLAGLPESKIREQYIRGLNPMNQYNVRMMAKYHNTRNNITKALVEAEKFSLLQGNFPFPPSGGQVLTPYEKTGLKGTIAKGQQTLKKPPGPGKRKADDLAINRFLDSFIDDTDLSEEAYDYDPIEDLRKQFEDLDINQAKLAQIIHASKAEINGLCEKLQMRYEKLLEYISSRDDSVNKEKLD
ncbi:17597_t:CDS:2, partial [Acaulospora morrowiae]